MFWLKDCKLFQGVSSIQIWGEKRYAMRIWFDPQKLSAYNLTPADVQDALLPRKCGTASGKLQVMQRSFP